MIDVWKEKIAECMISDDTDDMFSYIYEIDGYIEEVFVSPDGELPGYLTEGGAAAAGMFAAGIMHCYSVDAIPFFTLKIVKNEAILNESLTCDGQPRSSCFDD
jgi:hypothetical protein